MRETIIDFQSQMMELSKDKRGFSGSKSDSQPKNPKPKGRLY
jgi:hypothetical protein